MKHTTSFHSKRNWHKRRYKDKLKELEKRAPRWLVNPKATTSKTLKDGHASVTLTKTPDAPEPSYKWRYPWLFNAGEWSPRWLFKVELSWVSRTFVVPCRYKPVCDHILGEYDVQTFLNIILPTIPDYVFGPLSKRQITRLAHNHEYNTAELKQPSHKSIRKKLHRERHWYSGMTNQTKGRTQLHQDLKKTAQLYNQALRQDETPERRVLLDTELWKDCWCSCSYCIDTWGEPIIVDTVNYVSDDAILVLQQAEQLDGKLKQSYDKWVYTY